MVSLHSLATTMILFAAACSQTPPRFSPSCKANLGVAYSDYMTVEPGSFFRASDDLLALPSISCELLDIYRSYTVFMIDLDVIEGGKATTILHWYQADLLLQPDSGRLFNLTDNGASYVGPTPPPGPSHRYVFLLFAQPADYRFPECFSDMLPLTLGARQGFDLEQFMDVANFGQPIAANYYTVANPEAATSTRVATATSLSSADCPRAQRTSSGGHVDLR